MKTTPFAYASFDLNSLLQGHFIISRVLLYEHADLAALHTLKGIYWKETIAPILDLHFHILYCATFKIIVHY